MEGNNHARGEDLAFLLVARTVPVGETVSEPWG